MMFQHFLLKSCLCLHFGIPQCLDLVFSWKPKPKNGTNGGPLVVKVVGCQNTTSQPQTVHSGNEESRDVRYDKPENNGSLLVILAENPPGFSRAVSHLGPRDTDWFLLWISYGVSGPWVCPHVPSLEQKLQDFWTIKDHEIMIGDLTLNRDSWPSLIVKRNNGNCFIANGSLGNGYLSDDSGLGTSTNSGLTVAHSHHV